MRNWISKQYREHPWLAIGVCAYLVLSGVEAARHLLLANPLDRHDEGFSAWRVIPADGDDGGAILVRQAAPHSTMVRPVHGAVLGLNLVHNGSESADAPTPVTFTIDGQDLDTYSLHTAGTYSFRYYLPPILGAEKWAEVDGTLAERARFVAESSRDGWLGQLQELVPWQLPPEPPSVHIDTAIGAAPNGPSGAISEAAGRREAIVGITDVEWLDELPADGAGFHLPGSASDGIEYQWTRRWFAQPLEAMSREAVLLMRAIHPDIDQRPVVVDIFWNADLLRTASLPGSEWTHVAVGLPTEAAHSGVLSIRVSHTWSPARAGVSPDTRELGVAFAGVTWR